MSLILFGHHFSSYTQKVITALYENELPFEFRNIGPETPEYTADWARRWPIRKFPLLLDGDRQVAETSIIIEYLHLHHPGPVSLLPDDPAEALEVRFMDRFFDLHIMEAAQHAVDGAITGDPARRTEGMAKAVDKLDRAYPWLEQHMTGRMWAAGEAFSMADCAASPFLFYADWVHPIPESCPGLRAYRARLLARPAFARAVDEARYFRPHFPLGAPDRD